MKNLFKRTVAVLLVVVMTFGIYLPLGEESLFNLFFVEASAASVTSSTTGKFVIFLPAGVKMYSCSSVTGSKNSTPYFYNSSNQLTIYATEKCVLSSGSVRFLITANTASGSRTLYYELPSSASAYQLPAGPDSISSSGRMCHDQYAELTWDTDSFVDFYIVEVYDGDTLIISQWAYPTVFNESKTVAQLDLSDYVIYGSPSYETFDVSITPVREINDSWYYGYTNNYSDVGFNSCQVGVWGGIYGINFYANGGTGGPSTQNWSNPCSGTTTLTSEVPSRSGYTFLGWSTSSMSTYPTYYPGSSLSFDHNFIDLYAVWSKNTYTLSYNANGGNGAPSSQSGNTTYTVSSIVPTLSGYNFLGWSTNNTASTPSYTAGNTITISQNTTLYAVWSKTPTYTVSYNANGGTGAPESQIKTEDITLALSSLKPSKQYSITYNANGGELSSTGKTVNCAFKNWNTTQNGTGTSYVAGANYTSNSAATLYAQWANPTAGVLPTPTRTGYIFDGWYTSASGGAKVTSSTTITSNITLYAHWREMVKEDIYNLGEETYSFKNMSLKDDYYKCEAGKKGHCFGMSVTSSGYYIGELDISKIGATKGQELYDLSLTPAVQYQICEYQDLQGPNREGATVAGGSWYLNNHNYDTYSDWNDVVNYVKNHKHDGKGMLQVGLRSEAGGHAVNFLRYEEIDGQPRIYIYDNNYPDIETYIYMDSSGLVRQAPRTLFYNGIKCVALRSMPKYFEIVKDADKTRYLYAEKDSIVIDGAIEYEMECAVGETQYIMFVVPDSAAEVIITPLVDNAEFTYLDESYSFGSINDDTVGVFTLASSDDDSISTPELKIENENKSFFSMIVDFFMMIIGFILLPFTLLL